MRVNNFRIAQPGTDIHLLHRRQAHGSAPALGPHYHDSRPGDRRVSPERRDVVDSSCVRNGIYKKKQIQQLRGPLSVP